jgi:hypothetical protein
MTTLVSLTEAVVKTRFVICDFNFFQIIYATLPLPASIDALVLTHSPASNTKK